jgi:hypothetical protein
MGNTLRYPSAADFGAQLLTKGGFSGVGTGGYGYRWEFANKGLIPAWDKGKVDIRMGTRMTEEQIKAFVTEMGATPLARKEVAELMIPTNTISLGGEPFRVYKTYKQLVGKEDAPESSWKGKLPYEDTGKLTHKEDMKLGELALLPIMLVGVVILALWYFLAGNMRRG